MLRKALTAAIAAALAATFLGCHLQEADGNFVLINQSNSTTQLLIAGNSVGPIVGPQSSSGRFHAKMPLPSDPGCAGTTSPSCDQYYRTSNVSVQVYDFTRKRIVDQQSCTAGENVVLTITYTIIGTSPYEYANVWCQTQYNRVPAKDTLGGEHAP